MSDVASILKAPERLWLTSDAAHAVRDALVAAGAGVVGLLDGAQARDTPKFMAAVAQALAFPDYFGANWDAFAECLDDLHWRDEAVVLVVDHAAQLLADAPADRDILLKIIDDAFPANAELPRSLFKLVLVGDPSAAIVERARQLGSAVGRLA
jgi:hypothetical protein